MLDISEWLKSCWPQLSADLPEAAIERTFTDDKVIDGRTVKGTRKGYNTTGYGYQYVVDRLNEVLGIGGWRSHATYEIEEFQTTGQYPKDMYEVTAQVTIEIGHVNELGVWVALATRECHGGHASLTKADALKGAFTNGFKKTAALFGVGSKAYRGDISDDNTPRPEAPGEGARKPQAQRQQQIQASRTPAPAANPTSADVWSRLDTAAKFFGGRQKLLAAIQWGENDWPRNDAEASEALETALLEHKKRAQAQKSKSQSKEAGRNSSAVPTAKNAAPPPETRPPPESRPRLVEAPKASETQPTGAQSPNQTPKEAHTSRAPDSKTATDLDDTSQGERARSVSKADLSAMLRRCRWSTARLANEIKTCFGAEAPAGLDAFDAQHRLLLAEHIEFVLSQQTGGAA